MGKLDKKGRSMKRVHRLVVLPDYQGIGIGSRLLDCVANLYHKKNKRVFISTSAPSLIHSLKKNKRWKCIFFGRQTPQTNKELKKNSSINRVTASFQYRSGAGVLASIGQ